MLKTSSRRRGLRPLSADEKTLYVPDYARGIGASNRHVPRQTLPGQSMRLFNAPESRSKANSAVLSLSAGAQPSQCGSQANGSIKMSNDNKSLRDHLPYLLKNDGSRADFEAAIKDIPGPHQRGVPFLYSAMRCYICCAIEHAAAPSTPA